MDIHDVINVVGGLKSTLNNLRVLAESTEGSRSPLLNSTIDGRVKTYYENWQRNSEETMRWDQAKSELSFGKSWFGLGKRSKSVKFLK